MQTAYALTFLLLLYNTYVYKVHVHVQWHIAMKGTGCFLTEMLYQWYVITGIQLPLVAETMSTIRPANSLSSTITTSSAEHSKKRPSGANGNSDSDNETPNPKRRRTSKYRPDRLSCLPCVLWRQSDSDTRLEKYHPINNSCHAGKTAKLLSEYASFDDVSFNVESSDCVCEPCYKDYTRNRYNKENVTPRWAKIRTEVYTQMEEHTTKHCIYCCGNMCECEQIQHWGSDQWHGNDTAQMWKRYLSLNGKVDYAIGEHINHVCRTHYRRILELKSKRTCTICNAHTMSNWKMVCDIVDSPGKAFPLELGSVHFFDWICDQCCSRYFNGI